MPYPKNASLRFSSNGGFILQSYPITINACGEQSYWYPFGWFSVWFEYKEIIRIRPKLRDWDDDHLDFED